MLSLLDEQYDAELALRAEEYLKMNHPILIPRKQWPGKDMFQHESLPPSKRIDPSLQAEKGRALCLWRDAGWGGLVARGKYQESCFSDTLVYACAEMVKRWAPQPEPRWVTCIPSLKHPNLVPHFADRLATLLKLPFINCIQKQCDHPAQKKMENSYLQVKNLDGVFKVHGPCHAAPCLLIDDIVASRWTLTLATALLRQAGCSMVYPTALALNNPRMD